MKAESNLISLAFQVWEQLPLVCLRKDQWLLSLCHSSPNVSTFLALKKDQEDEDVILPYYWPKQSGGLSTSRSLCSLLLRAEQKTSICSSKIVQIAATRDKYKGCLETEMHILGFLTFFFFCWSSECWSYYKVKPQDGTKIPKFMEKNRQSRFVSQKVL